MGTDQQHIFTLVEMVAEEGGLKQNVATVFSGNYAWQCLI